ncbi:cysteine rich repeat-containing protein [Acuticoccus kandeliae]|uniref:cysteine rich repeat-containing protein n=1 Tax=Acuticoccus kandeliae TaxID=2073160 RepID=UPI000D3E6ECE|nr:cysteine rich repeat-containing protein [Acuticoccus kandeliae]
MAETRPLRVALFAALAALCATAPAIAQQQLTREQARAVAQACRGDVQRFCASVRFGGGELRTCLQENAANLSDSCKAQLIAVMPQ